MAIAKKAIKKKTGTKKTGNLGKTIKLQEKMLKRKAVVKQAMKELRWHDHQLEQAFSKLHNEFHLTHASWERVLNLERELAVNLLLARNGARSIRNERIMFSAQTDHGPIKVEITKTTKGWKMDVKE